MNSQRFQLLCFSVVVVLQSVAQNASDYKTVYQPDNGGIMGYNTGRFNNRPLYINNTDAFVLTGDKPIMRFAQGAFYYGTFSIQFERAGMRKAICHFSSDTSIYYPGKMIWILSDSAYPGLRLELQLLTAATTNGFSLKLKTENFQTGDKLIWAYGGARLAHEREEQYNNFSWALDVMGHPEILNWEKDTISPSSNYVHVEGKKGFVQLIDTLGRNQFVVSAECSALTRPEAKETISGVVDLKDNPTTYWIIRATKDLDPLMINGIKDPRQLFAEAMKKNELLVSRLKIHTPDRYLDAVAQSTVAAIDGTWYPPVFHHGAMQWNVRFPGWRVLSGASVFGWHDRLKTEASYYIESQVRDSDKETAKADSNLLLTAQAPESRFFGNGYISRDQNFYNMQSQFFDQLIDEYRMTNDPELIKILYPALELHLQWLEDCFDPDRDGLYESYLNTWPTDSQWYNGGGTAEETSYAYKAHLAARDMSLQMKDRKSAEYHSFMAEKIRKSFFKNIWLDSLGYSGSYREQGAHERVHTNPWLYSIFLPIEANMLNREQAVASLYYSESDLQNDSMPAGGKTVWTSNWVPGIWSVRENWPGDNYALAESYFKTGLSERGWELLKGSFMHTAFDHLTPGNLGGVQGGIDFGDCMNPFVKTVVEGLFGFHPDFPNGRVTLSPSLPVDWDFADIEIPDYSLHFKKSADRLSYQFKIDKPAALDIFIPVYSSDIKSVVLNRDTVNWTWADGYGKGLIHIQTKPSKEISLSIQTGDSISYRAIQEIHGEVGEEFRLDIEADSILELSDPQHLFEQVQIDQRNINLKFRDNPGNHSFFVKTITGHTPQYQIFHVRLKNSQREIAEKNRIAEKIPVDAHWKEIRIDSFFNADVTAIYKQKYLSPRPNTVSVRLGVDGYSPWTFPYWKIKPPVIQLDSLRYLTRSKTEIKTPQGIPFYLAEQGKNISFTSLWDNYPSTVNFPVNAEGKVCYFLICGSTNVMQCQIANAYVKLNYADGTVDSLALIPPVNYWNLSHINGSGGGPGQLSSNDYLSPKDKFCLPSQLPETVSLGRECRAMLLNLKMKPGIILKSVSLETVSQEVVVGLMGLTIAY